MAAVTPQTLQAIASKLDEFHQLNGMPKGNWVASSVGSATPYLTFADTAAGIAATQVSQWNQNQVIAFAKAIEWVNANSNPPLSNSATGGPLHPPCVMDDNREPGSTVPKFRPRMYDFTDEAEANRFLKWMQDNEIALKTRLAAGLQNPANANNNNPNPNGPILGAAHGNQPNPPPNGWKFTPDEERILRLHMAECDAGRRPVSYEWKCPNKTDIHQGIKFYHPSSNSPSYTAVPGVKGAEFQLNMAAHDDALQEAVIKAVAAHGGRLSFTGGSSADEQRIKDITLAMYRAGVLLDKNGNPLTSPPLINGQPVGGVNPAPQARGGGAPVNPPQRPGIIGHIMKVSRSIVNALAS